MNFHDKKVIPPKYIYLFLAVICFILLFFSVILEDRVSFLKTVTSAIITPMQSGINEVGTTVYNNVTNQKEREALLSENKDLQAKLDDASARIEVYEQESYELKRLQALLDLKEQYVNYNTVGARVIATDSSNWFYTFVIDKGEDDGVLVGCNILADGGLAGIVTETGSDYAKVRAIIDDNSQVSANISGTETLCTISGSLAAIRDGYINVDYINKLDTVEEGAELVTSHVSNKFLPGILIGYVTDVVMDANNLTKSAKCIPVVDFHNLQEVLVVLDRKANYKTDSVNKNIYDNVTDTQEPATGDEEDTDSHISGTGEEETGEQAVDETGFDDAISDEDDSGQASSGMETESDDEDPDEQEPYEDSPDNGE